MKIMELLSEGIIALLVSPVIAHAQSVSGAIPRSGRRGPAPGSGVTIDGVTNTQAVLSYNAPDVSACTVKVSEDPSYSPLVKAVNTALFPGSDSDGGGATARTFVVGKRLTETSPADSRNYSLALQADTRHYYQITCGASVYTGSFTTANIPFNSTYQDAPQTDPANPGNVLLPTLSDTDRNQTIVDPKTGALIRQVSLPSDTNYGLGGGNNGPFLYDGGAVKVCGENLITAGSVQGYLCSFAAGDGGNGVLYFIIPATGEARYLGHFQWPYPFINPKDSQFYMNYFGALAKITYTGDYSQAPNNSAASFSVTTILPDVYAAITTFDPTFDPTLFKCADVLTRAGFKAIGDYITLNCRRGSQGSYGWAVVVQISTASVIAATPTFMNIQSRWCDTHSLDDLYDTPLMQIATHDMNAHLLGQGPYLVSYTDPGTLDTTTTSISVSGEPACPDCGTDPAVPPAQEGDTFLWMDGTHEKMRLVTKLSSTSWIVRRGVAGTTAASHLTGATAMGECLFTPSVWKFTEDPHGRDTTNTKFVAENMIAFGHGDWDTNLWAVEHWPIRIGDLTTTLNQPVTRNISSEPPFAGKVANCYGNACTSHLSAAHNQPWFSDYFLWQWASGTGDILVNMTGQLYKVTGAWYANWPKHFPNIGVTGSANSPHVLLDVSGPGVMLATDSSDNYKFCMANVANECYKPSAPGDIFVNLPGSVAGVACSGTSTCIGSFSGYGANVLQIGLNGDIRRISMGLAQPRKTTGFATAKMVDPSWLLFSFGNNAGPNLPARLLMAKLPPFTMDDSVDRTTFIRAPISINSPSGLGIATATVEFGYLEQGAITDHYCASRREVCVVVDATVNDAVPFYFKSTDTYTMAPCAASCTITLPVLPQHVAYYQVKFYDVKGAFVQNGTSGVAIEGAVK